MLFVGRQHITIYISNETMHLISITCHCLVTILVTIFTLFQLFSQGLKSLDVVDGYTLAFHIGVSETGGSMLDDPDE